MISFLRMLKNTIYIFFWIHMSDFNLQMSICHTLWPIYRINVPRLFCFPSESVQSMK
jgi:hypothetical protein